MDLRPATDRRGLTRRIGEVVILEGDGTLISGIDDQLGIRFDEERNDLAAVTARFAETVDAPGILILFTTFDDRGAGGPAYYVPLYNDVAGTGMGVIDQRAEFGATALVGVANMKRRASHGDRIMSALAHEIAHRHLAYFPPVTTGTTALDLLGRQGAHWHALLSTDASLLGGHALRETEPGRFVVVARNLRFSSLDLYGLGLLPAEEVEPFFFVQYGATEAGAPIPAAAELSPGAVIVGTRIDLTVEDVVSAAGPRDASEETLNLFFALITRPEETATATAVVAEAERIDRLRGELETTWSGLTRGVGRLCTKIDGCASKPVDAGLEDASTVDFEERGCGCAASGRGGEGAGRPTEPVGLAPALLLALFRFRPRCRARGRSSDRCCSRDPRPRRGAPQPSGSGPPPDPRSTSCRARARTP